MLKISIINHVTKKQYESLFETSEEANIWLEQGKKKNIWGSGERIETVDEIHKNERAIFLQEVITQEPKYDKNWNPVLDEQGNVCFIEVKKYKYLIPCEYEINVEEHIDSLSIEKERDQLLGKTDWLFISDNPVPTKHRQYYKEYRQLLRNISLNIPQIEPFDNFLRRLYPNEFLDGGEADKIIKRFKRYL